jgi:L-gulonate 3-dehydrogenase
MRLGNGLSLKERTMSASEVRVAAIVGAGVIGTAWAIAFSVAGWQVKLYDVSAIALDAARRTVRARLDDLSAAGLSAEEPSAAHERVSFHDDLASAVAGAILIQECTLEQLASKIEVFDKLDRLAPPNALLASSTSAIAGSQFLTGRGSSPRCFVAHPANPPYLLPIVELCATEQTSPHSIEAARQIYLTAGMAPVLLRREIDGFLLNRLQAAVVGEALQLVAQGYASPEDIDTVMTAGLGLRWAFLGPFATMHLNHPDGFAAYMQMFGETYRRLTTGLMAGEAWPDDLMDIVARSRDPGMPASTVREAQAWRDRRLMALRAHLATQLDFVPSG